MKLLWCLALLCGSITVAAALDRSGYREAVRGIRVDLDAGREAQAVAAARALGAQTWGEAGRELATDPRWRSTPAAAGRLRQVADEVESLLAAVPAAAPPVPDPDRIDRVLRRAGAWRPPLDRQPAGTAPELRSDLHLLGKLQMLPTTIGLRQSLLQLAPGEQNRAAWAQLPPLEGANRFAGVQPGAVVLAETQEKAPLLVAREYGRGRVLAFAGDTTWKWWLAGHQALHKRFWRQSVLWLARKDETAENRVWVKLDQRRFRPGSRVEFSAGAETPEGEPLPDAVLQAEIMAPDGTRRRVTLRRQDQLHQGTYLDTRLPGDYTIVVEARQGDTPLGSARARFLVYEQDLELDNPAADPGLLASLSAITGVDRPITPEELPRLLEQLQKETEKLEVETQVRRTLYDNWLLLVLFVAVLCCEWYLRKRWGLV